LGAGRAERVVAHLVGDLRLDELVLGWRTSRARRPRLEAAAAEPDAAFVSFCEGKIQLKR
jgi:hypothetical protein